MDFQKLDPEILKHLPKDCTLVSLAKHGKTNWSTGYKVSVETPDGEEHEYFLKVLDRPRGDEMARGEFESQKALMAYIPEAISKPLATGTFQSDPSLAFYITGFRYIREGLPSFKDLLAIVKKLHTNSVSPNGKFGFPVTTFYGPPAYDNTWTDSWEEYFTREFIASLAYAQKILGDETEMAEVAQEFIDKVIPRLLRVLQTGGRSIKPTLCFGDLWDENVHVDLETEMPFLFDPVCYYGHNESDFQCMRSSRYSLDQKFVYQYHDDVGPSEPAEDFDDRNALYAIRNDLRLIGLWPIWASRADHVKSEMRRLLSKHPQGFEGFVEPDANAQAFASNQNIEIKPPTTATTKPKEEPASAAGDVSITA